MWVDGVGEGGKGEGRGGGRCVRDVWGGRAAREGETVCTDEWTCVTWG